MQDSFLLKPEKCHLNVTTSLKMWNPWQYSIMTLEAHSVTPLRSKTIHFLIWAWLLDNLKSIPFKSVEYCSLFSIPVWSLYAPHVTNNWYLSGATRRLSPIWLAACLSVLKAFSLENCCLQRKAFMRRIL